MMLVRASSFAAAVFTFALVACSSDGSIMPVNARNCTDGYCLDAAHTCPNACSAFGYTWAGTAGGGPSQK